MKLSMRTVQIRIVFLWGHVASHSQVYPKSWILGIFSSGDVPVPMADSGVGGCGSLGEPRIRDVCFGVKKSELVPLFSAVYHSYPSYLSQKCTDTDFTAIEVLVYYFAQNRQILVGVFW